jgi:hypothetical protein
MVLLRCRESVSSPLPCLIGRILLLLANTREYVPPTSFVPFWRRPFRGRCIMHVSWSLSESCSSLRHRRSSCLTVPIVCACIGMVHGGLQKCSLRHHEIVRDQGHFPPIPPLLSSRLRSSMADCLFLLRHCPTIVAPAQ